ncbi:uncharacterized protein TRIADDRAFT_31072 [Trichoplax adhaerens]|uniref:Solute carrier organic anion transporter family member n=1 Tax=Trichoplax adhaerens TaxID=10228 RepID=B3S8K7_TRIAD|nr:hypothetical protein TRIADDRAFT_31072 [Trichoplax adhaerens]EDV20901.1 hypothetical protein TRIADDRAFT_31072 [Trichoplax adhaerens]|eukprot:XP_002116545.1 hypothetical protein TRIADDRAFT_31072 [Trichoplax adhaerens]
MEKKKSSSKSPKLRAIDSTKDTDNTELGTKERYGCFNIHPDWLQVFNNRKWLAFLIGVCQLLFSTVTSGYESSIVSTLQRGFGLSSTDIGGISVCFSVAQSTLGVILSHKAANSHKGRWVGITAIIAAIGCFIYALPHFVTKSYGILSSYQNGNQSYGICSSTSKPSPLTDQEQASQKGLYIFLFCLGQFVIGAGTSILRSIGWSYLDENVSPSVSALYTGINLSLLGLGIALGFVFGGTALDLYVYWPAEVSGKCHLTIDNPNWIGAWWLGYIVIAAIIILMAFPILALPRHLPNYEYYKMKRAQQAEGKSKIDRYKSKTLKDLIPSLKDLLLNMPFMCTVLNLVGNLIVLAGVGVFFPKYIESQYGVLASSASMYTGIMIVVGMLVGIVLGGGYMKYKKLKVLGLAKFAAISTTLSTVTVAAFLIAVCPRTLIAGVNIPYHNEIAVSQTHNLSDNCNSGCYCDSETFKPVCDLSTGITYFSPCYAGCTSKGIDFNNGQQVFGNCSCLSTNTNAMRNHTQSLDVVLNYCPKECNALIPFIIMGIIFAFLVYCSLIPSYQVILRCVPESQRPLALAVQWVFIQCLANIPGPILLGTFIDGACSLWEVQNGERAFCWIYDNQLLAYGLAGVILAMRIFSAIFSILAWYFLKRDIKKYSGIEKENIKDDHEADEKEPENNIIKPSSSNQNMVETTSKLNGFTETLV